MNYQEEIIRIVKTITQDHVLRFIYSLIRIIASDLCDYECVFKSLSESFTVE